MLCAAAGLARAADLRVSVADAAGQPVADAIVYATAQAAPVRTATAKAVIDQVHRRFVPRVSVVQTGTAISFPNSDNIRHSVYSFSPARTFTLKLYAGTPANPVVFDKPGIVVLGCNIHDSMVAWVLIGHQHEEDLEVVLRAWNNSMSQEQPGEVLRVSAAAPAPMLLHVDAQALEGMP